MYITLMPGNETSCVPSDSMRVRPAWSNRVIEAQRGHLLLCVIDANIGLPVTRVQQSSTGTLRLFYNGMLKMALAEGQWHFASVRGLR